MKRFIPILLVLVACAAPVLANKQLERTFYSPYYQSVEDGIRIGAQKHAVYAYIIANASTPGVDLISLLPPEDQEELSSIIPLDDEQRRAVLLEFVLAKQGMNSRRLATLTAVWGGKAKSLKNVITLGK